MNNSILAAYSDGVYILFLILIMIAVILVIVFFIFRIRRERMQYSEAHVEKNVSTEEWLKKYVTRMIAASVKRTVFYIYQIDIRDYSNLKKTLGDSQYDNLLSNLCDSLHKLLPWGIKVGVKKKDSVVMYVRGSGNVDPSGLAEMIIKTVVKESAEASSIGVEIDVNVSVVAFPAGGKTSEELFKNLELAMVVSRRQGVNKYAFYTAQMGNKETEEYRYYQEIKDAMKAKEFTLYYQPVVDTNSMEVAGAEALIRWQHRTMGVLPPASFLYVMEKTGDINWVGNWCFQNMIKQHNLWRTNYENRFFVSINLSERQLLNPTLADELRDAVIKQKAFAGNFVMEVGAMSLYHSSEIVKNNIDRLKEYGFRVAIDRFGTDFTSPSLLEQLPVSVIKIDAKFWKNAAESNIASDIISMLVKYAQEKSIMLIPEGVETKEEMLKLRQMGFNYMQGYLFAKPLDSREFISDVLLTPWSNDLRDA